MRKFHRLTLLACLPLLSGFPARGFAAPEETSAACADGKPHTFRLQQNRDRLLGTLAAQKGTDACSLWGKMSLAERDIFEMVTAYLGSCDSRLAAPPSSSDETALDRARILYSINAPGLQDIEPSPVPSEGGACGGYDSNRVFIGFDPAALSAMRESHEKFGQSWGGPLNPKHVRGYNWWRASNDPGGPHTPFTERDMICWGGLLPCWVRFANSEGPTWHFFSSDGDIDSDATRKKLWSRRGVCGVVDPDLVELTIAFNLTHESDPLCGAGWKKEIVNRIGPANFRSYKPGGSCDKPPVNNDPHGEKDRSHAGLGPDQLDHTCRAPAAASGKIDLRGAAELIDNLKTRAVDDWDVQPPPEN